MTPTQRALLDAILASPDDDAPRLIYADWLDDNPDDDTIGKCCHERAEFIRLQCALDRITTDHPDYQAMKKRERELLADGRDYAWFFPRGRFLQSAEWRFHRGFVTYLALHGDDLVRLLDEIVALHPLNAVRLFDLPPVAWGPLIARPHTNLDLFSTSTFQENARSCWIIDHPRRHEVLVHHLEYPPEARQRITFMALRHLYPRVQTWTTP